MSPRPKKHERDYRQALWYETVILLMRESYSCLACKKKPSSLLAHIVPQKESLVTENFLPNLYPCCGSCNAKEHHNRDAWRKKHGEMFGHDFVEALYDYAKNGRVPTPADRIKEVLRIRLLTGREIEQHIYRAYRIAGGDSGLKFMKKAKRCGQTHTERMAWLIRRDLTDSEQK